MRIRFLVLSLLVLCLAVTLRMLCALERLRAKKRINGEVRILRQNVERFDEVADDFSRRQMRGRAFAVIFELEKACERLIAQHETRGK